MTGRSRNSRPRPEGQAAQGRSDDTEEELEHEAALPAVPKEKADDGHHAVNKQDAAEGITKHGGADAGPDQQD